MGIDWEEMLGAEGDQLWSAYEDRVCEAMELERQESYYRRLNDQQKTIKLGENNVNINGTWCGHEFTQEELDKLAAGKIIEFEYQDRKGEERKVKGKLLNKRNAFGSWAFCPSFSKEYLEDQYFSGEFNGRKVYMKKEWGGHIFTTEETEKLFAGESIKIEYKTKSGKRKTTKGSLQEYANSESNYVRFKPDFE